MNAPFRYSYSNFVYGTEDVKTSAARLQAAGYDGIELVGEPDRYDARRVREIAEAHGLGVSSIGSVFSTDRDFSADDEAIRREADRYVRRIVDMAAATGAPVAILAPAACGRTHGGPRNGEEHSRMVDALRQSGEYAASLGVELAIEPWNRYETHLLNRLDQATALAREIDLPNVGVMADVFHMNVEERAIDDAIREAGDLLRHVHLSDSNRSVPGSGHVDFAAVFNALRDVDYRGYLVIELLPASADPIAVLEEGGAEEFRNPYTADAIAYLKDVEQSLSTEAPR
ncbi:MAG TPA: sugar phosphate isomerase/epimerase family protein [Solirubrobacteraceae bacterium]|jgi:sugar phosphate isomerase/epimerase